MNTITGPSFEDDLKAKEAATGLTLTGIPGFSWTIGVGLDYPLPDSLSPAQVAAIHEVVAAHDPTQPPFVPETPLSIALGVALADVAVPESLKDVLRKWRDTW